jgi:hypothetical protein
MLNPNLAKEAGKEIDTTYQWRKRVCVSRVERMGYKAHTCH